MSTVKCATIVNASSATNNLSLDASGNVTVGAGLTLTGGALNVGGSVGSAGQILKSNGTTSSWVNGWTLINTITGTGAAALQDTTSLTSTYSEYRIFIRYLLPATNSVSMQLQLYSGGAYQATSYLANAFVTSGSAATTFIPLGRTGQMSNTATYPGIGQFIITNPSSTTLYKPVNGLFSSYDAGLTYYAPCMFAGVWTGGTGAITGFQILASSGNITGTVEVWGAD